MTAQNTCCFMVAIYLEDRRYGGPEEGGWWYTAGRRCDEMFPELGEHGLPKSFLDEDAAIAWAAAVNEKIDATLNHGRRPIGSVLSTGRYCAHVHEGWPPECFPETTPHWRGQNAVRQSYQHFGAVLRGASK